jgi:myo-inositol 2-dehydrogenase/D-chiro-inositol 1-dehydrogenase
MVRAENVAATTVESAGAHGFTREPALPFFLERYAAAYRIELQEFLKALRGEPARLASGHDGLRALQLADAAQRSLEQGTAIRI